MTLRYLGILWVILTLISLSGCSDEDDDDDLDFLCEDIFCEDYECPDTDECLFGIVEDVCECCLICAKGPGENCGGMYDLAGTCAFGSFCQTHPKYPQLPGVCVEF